MPLRSGLTFLFPSLRKKREVHYCNCSELGKKSKITILLSPPVTHKLKKGEGGKVEHLLGLNIFMDVSVTQTGHLFLVGSGFLFVPSVVRLSVFVQKELKC